MIPSLVGLIVMALGLVLIHYGLHDTLNPLRPVAQPVVSVRSTN